MAEIKFKQNNHKKVKQIFLKSKEKITLHSKNIVQKTNRVVLKFWANIIWYVHLFIVIIAIAPFFIPFSILPGRTDFQFYYIWGILGLQVIAGLIYWPITKKFQFVCPLTAIEKHILKSKPHKHVGESCIADFCAEKLGMPKWIGTICVITVLIIVTIQKYKLV